MIEVQEFRAEVRDWLAENLVGDYAALKRDGAFGRALVLVESGGESDFGSAFFLNDPLHDDPDDTLPRTQTLTPNRFVHLSPRSNQLCCEQQLMGHLMHSIRTSWQLK